jgi:dUTP pyrophosphatase
MKAKVKILRSEAKLPTRAYSDDAGLDFYYCPEEKEGDITIRPMGNAIIPTGVSIEVPSGYMLEMKNKSGIAAKKQLLVGSCVIDRGYTGEIFVNLNNVGTDVQIIEPGQKVVQGVFVKIAQPELIIIDPSQDLYEKSDRQSGSLGSTGDF